jgi:ribosome-binding protein aMBF1 (putative translation factor)
MDFQDWTPVVAKKSKARAHTSHLPSHTPGVSTIHRLENEELPTFKKHLSPETRQHIVAKRVEKGWNQQQLNAQCSFPPNTVRDIENGRQIPTPMQLNILNRVLGISLKFETK